MSPLPLSLLVTLLLAASFTLGNRGSMASSITAPTAITRPSYIECQDNSECNVNHCCVLVGGSTYSIPRCLPKSALGAACRMNEEIEDFNLWYPNDLSLNISAYRYICPCKDGLYCVQHQCALRSTGPDLEEDEEIDQHRR